MGFELPAFGAGWPSAEMDGRRRLGRRQACPPSAAGFRTEPTRQDGMDRRFFAPGQLRRAYLQQRGPSELLREIVEEEWVQLEGLDSLQAELKVLEHIH